MLRLCLMALLSFLLAIASAMAQVAAPVSSDAWEGVREGERDGKHGVPWFGELPPPRDSAFVGATPVYAAAYTVAYIKAGYEVRQKRAMIVGVTVAVVVGAALAILFAQVYGDVPAD